MASLIWPLNLNNSNLGFFLCVSDFIGSNLKTLILGMFPTA